MEQILQTQATKAYSHLLSKVWFCSPSVRNIYFRVPIAMTLTRESLRLTPSYSDIYLRQTHMNYFWKVQVHRQL